MDGFPWLTFVPQFPFLHCLDTVGRVTESACRTSCFKLLSSLGSLSGDQAQQGITAQKRYIKHKLKSISSICSGRHRSIVTVVVVVVFTCSVSDIIYFSGTA